MLTLSCLCDQVRIELGKSPDFIHECNCLMCRKTGARWGYFHPSEITVSGATRGFSRQDKAVPNAEVRFCATCGATTHFVLTAAAAAKFGDTLAGVNMALAAERDLAGIELRYPDGAAWSGEGDFTYVREPRVLGRDGRVDAG